MSGVRVEKSCSRSSYIAPVIQGAGKQTEEQDKRHMPVFLCGMFLEAATQSNLDPIHQNLVIATYSCKRADLDLELSPVPETKVSAKLSWLNIHTKKRHEEL